MLYLLRASFFLTVSPVSEGLLPVGQRQFSVLMLFDVLQSMKDCQRQSYVPWLCANALPCHAVNERLLPAGQRRVLPAVHRGDAQARQGPQPGVQPRSDWYANQLLDWMEFQPTNAFCLFCSGKLTRVLIRSSFPFIVTASIMQGRGGPIHRLGRSPVPSSNASGHFV